MRDTGTRRSVRTVVALVSAGAAVGYAAGRRAYAARSDRPAPPLSARARAREAPRKLRALADLGVEQARQVVHSLPGSVRIVAAAPPEPEREPEPGPDD